MSPAQPPLTCPSFAATGNTGNLTDDGKSLALNLIAFAICVTGEIHLDSAIEMLGHVNEGCIRLLLMTPSR